MSDKPDPTKLILASAIQDQDLENIRRAWTAAIEEARVEMYNFLHCEDAMVARFEMATAPDVWVKFLQLIARCGLREAILRHKQVEELDEDSV